MIVDHVTGTMRIDRNAIPELNSTVPNCGIITHESEAIMRMSSSLCRRTDFCFRACDI